MPDPFLPRARDGDPAALSALYEAYHARVYRYLFFRTGSHALAEDLTADVFMRVLEALPRYRMQGAPFAAWLFQIARHRFLDHCRRHRVTQTPLDEDMPDGEPDPLTQTERHLTTEALMQALHRLPRTQHEVILLRFIAGLPLADVAQALHRSEDAIKGLQRRALLHLRQLLTSEDKPTHDPVRLPLTELP